LTPLVLIILENAPASHREGASSRGVRVLRCCHAAGALQRQNARRPLLACADSQEPHPRPRSFAPHPQRYRGISGHGCPRPRRSRGGLYPHDQAFHVFVRSPRWFLREREGALAWVWSWGIVVSEGRDRLFQVEVRSAMQFSEDQKTPKCCDMSILRASSHGRILQRRRPEGSHPPASRKNAGRSSSISVSPNFRDRAFFSLQS